ncbi:MAG: Rpn family recombination-promoting nuclease/putative transposase [Cyanobacteria bacterium P01_D01_bin.14]
MFDTVCKFLVETFSADFATWLLGEPVALTELSPSELSLEPIRADALILLQSEATVLHLEFQSRPDPDMAFRMADYRLRVYRRFPQKAMRQIVIYLQPSQSAAVYQTTFEIPGMSYEFEVIRLWEQDPANFLTLPGLLPFAVLTQTADRPALLRQAAGQIEQLPERRLQSNVAASTAILAGLLLEKGLIQRVLRREIMQESVIYQEIRTEALQEGRREGLQEGRREGEVALVLKQLTYRMKQLPETIRSQISILSLSQLEALAEALLDFGTLEDAEAWLARQQEAISKALQALQAKLGELSPEVTAEVQTLSRRQIESLESNLTDFISTDKLMTWLQNQNQTSDQ